MSDVPARVAADAAAAEQQARELAEQLAQSTNVAPVDPAQPAQPAQPPAATPTTSDEQLRSMQARIDSMAGRLNEADRRATEAQNEARRAAEQLAEARRAAEQAPPAPAPAPAAPSFDSKDVEEYGADTLEMMHRVAAQVVGPVIQMVQQLRAELSNASGRAAKAEAKAEQAHSVIGETRAEKYYGSLDTEIPGWRAVNDDQKFMDWLENVEPLSKRKYGELLLTAHQRLDVEAVSAIFATFKPDLRGPAAPAPATTPSREQHVAPSTRGPAAAPPANGNAGRTYKMSEYNRKSDDMLRGRISRADFQAYEAEYLKAVAEGRVDTNA